MTSIWRSFQSSTFTKRVLRHMPVRMVLGSRRASCVLNLAHIMKGGCVHAALGSIRASSSATRVSSSGRISNHPRTVRMRFARCLRGRLGFINSCVRELAASTVSRLARRKPVGCVHPFSHWPDCGSHECVTKEWWRGCDGSVVWLGRTLEVDTHRLGSRFLTLRSSAGTP